MMMKEEENDSVSPLPRKSVMRTNLVNNLNKSISFPKGELNMIIAPKDSSSIYSSLVVDPLLFPKVGDYIQSGLNREVIITFLLFFLSFAEKTLKLNFSVTGSDINSDRWKELEVAAKEERERLESISAKSLKDELVRNTNSNSKLVSYFNNNCLTYARIGGGMTNFFRIQKKMADRDSDLLFICNCFASAAYKANNKIVLSGLNFSISDSENLIITLQNAFSPILKKLLLRDIKISDLISVKTFNFHGEVQLWKVYDPLNPPESTKQAVDIYPQKGYACANIKAYGIEFRSLTPLFSEPWIYQEIIPKAFKEEEYDRICIAALYKNAVQEAEKIAFTVDHKGFVFEAYLKSLKYGTVSNKVEDLAKEMTKKGLDIFLLDSPKIVKFRKTLTSLAVFKVFGEEEAKQILKHLS